jgi:hypothetical protein
MDVRQLSNDLFAKATAVAGASHETTPGAITAEIIGLCESLNANPPVYVPVGDDPHGMYGFCNLGVLDKIKAEGGEIRFGWNIWEYPGVYLTAEFHAVWVDPIGNLVDITPKPDRETRIVFAGDPTLPPDFDFAKRPNNRRARIYQPTDRVMLAKARIATFNRTQTKYETNRATRKGMTLEQWVAARLPVDPISGLIEGFIHAADEREKLWVPTPSGVGTRCTDPHRSNELIRKQQHYLREIERLVPTGASNCPAT